MNSQEIDSYRTFYGIREATEKELARMTEDQRWHYEASEHKPNGLHFEFFRLAGKPVRPVYLFPNGNIDYGGGIRGLGREAIAALRPCPLNIENKGEI